MTCHFYSDLNDPRPLAPYLCVMPGFSEQIETLLASVEDFVALSYAKAAHDAIAEAEDKSGDARAKVIGEVAKVGRAVKLFRGTGARLAGAIAGLRRVKDEAATDDQETAMNDDTAQWTPERIAELHAQVRERVAKLAGSLELKRMVERDSARSHREMPADPATSGGSPTPAG